MLRVRVGTGIVKGEAAVGGPLAAGGWPHAGGRRGWVYGGSGEIEVTVIWGKGRGIEWFCG
jgi:hypothetical protein